MSEIHSTYTFHSTKDPKELEEVYRLPANEWHGNMSIEDFVANMVKKQQYEDAKYTRAFYARSKDAIVATTVVLDLPAVGGRGLLVSFVVVHPEHRKGGLAKKMVDYAIGETEKVLDGSTTYTWALYSAVGKYYERCGFVAHSLQFYAIPTNQQEPPVRWLTIDDKDVISRCWADKKRIIREKMGPNSFAFDIDKSLGAPYLWGEERLGKKSTGKQAEAFATKGAVVRSGGKVYYALWNTIMSDTVVVTNMGAWDTNVEEQKLAEVDDPVSALLRACAYITGIRFPDQKACYVADTDVIGEVKVEGAAVSPEVPHVMPMIRDARGDVEWVANGMWSWG